MTLVMCTHIRKNNMGRGLIQTGMFVYHVGFVLVVVKNKPMAYCNC